MTFTLIVAGFSAALGFISTCIGISVIDEAYRFDRGVPCDNRWSVQTNETQTQGLGDWLENADGCFFQNMKYTVMMQSCEHPVLFACFVGFVAVLVAAVTSNRTSNSSRRTLISAVMLFACIPTLTSMSAVNVLGSRDSAPPGRI